MVAITALLQMRKQLSDAHRRRSKAQPDRARESRFFSAAMREEYTTRGAGGDTATATPPRKSAVCVHTERSGAGTCTQ